MKAIYVKTVGREMEWRISDFYGSEKRADI